MTQPVAAFVSYRLGGADGVGVEAAKWEGALRELGFRTRRVAGELEGPARPDDAWIPFLAIDPVPGSAIEPDVLGAALSGADLVVVENLCSLPLNLDAAATARDVLLRHPGRVCFHHHDFAWERSHLAHITGFPPDRPNSLHVTISEHARAELHRRGIDATCIPNSFDFDAFDGDRETTRALLGYTDADVVMVQPTRAIPRKNVPGGLRFAADVGHRSGAPVRYWITGPVEDGFDADFEQILATAEVPVHLGRAPRSADAYAAADLIVFPSTWEGFGNPVVEAAAARRMSALGTYPVLEEITAGLEVLSIDDADAAVEWMLRPAADRQVVLEENARVARARFSSEHLPDRIEAALTAVGWTDW